MNSSISLPKVKAGKVVLSKDPKIEFDFEMIDKKKVVNFSEYCKVCDEKYKELISTSTRNIIFVDELEIRVLDDASTSRDIHLVRNIITSIDRLNQITRKQSFNINFILAVKY